MMMSILHFHISTLTGMHGFWTDAVENTPDVKYKAVGKFEPTFLLWCAISEAGVSISTLFKGTVKGQDVDADVYITKMVQFIVKHHKNDETIF
jgi:hypothetical protein